MANAQVLQNAANRFASVAGFAPLAVDGAVGARTLDAVQRALSYISISSDDDGGIAQNAIPDTISAQASAFSSNAARSTSVLAANAAQVGAFLNYVADMLHLVPVYGPSVVPQTNAAVAAATGLSPPALRPAGSSIFDAFKRLATWQKVGLAAVGVLGVIAVAAKVKERKQLQGFRY